MISTCAPLHAMTNPEEISLYYREIHFVLILSEPYQSYSGTYNFHFNIKATGNIFHFVITVIPSAIISAIYNQVKL